MDKLAKESLKINKVAKFVSELLKTNEVMHPQSRESYRQLYGKFAPPTKRL